MLRGCIESLNQRPPENMKIQTQYEAAAALNTAAIHTDEPTTYAALRESSDMLEHQQPTPAQTYKTIADMTAPIYAHCAKPARDRFKTALDYAARQVAPEVKELPEFKRYRQGLDHPPAHGMSHSVYRAAAEAVAKLLCVSPCNAAEAITAAI